MTTTTETRDELFLADLRRQAEERLESGDRQGARQIWEAILQIDPDDATARERIAALAGEDTGEDGPDLDIDLDLDLDLAEERPAAPASAAAVTQELERSALPAEERAEVRDLVEAAGELVDGPPPGEPASGSQLPAPDPALGEAALLVESAQRAFDKGDDDEAIALASRAMALSEQVPGAQELIAAARTRAARRAAEGEQALLAGIEAVEQGRPEEAVALLEKALELLPGHPEAEEYLERARRAAAAAPAAPADAGGADEAEEIDRIESIPLAAPAAETTAPPGDAAGAESPAHRVPRVERVLPPRPDPVPLEMPAAGTLAGPLPSPAERKPAPPPGKGFSAVARRSSLGRVLLGLFVAGAAGLAVVAWRAPGLLVAGADAPAEDLIRPVRKGGSARPRKAAPKPEDRPAAAAEPAGKETSPASGKAAATDRPPAYTEKDLPRLIARADKLMAEGREAEAVETLEAARRVAPAEFAVLDRLEAARRVMQERRTAEERLADGKEAFAQGSYEDALRDFYRVPERFRPPRLDRWIANGWYNLGVLALQRGDVVEAAQHFRDALELSPGDAAAQRNLEVTRRYRQRGALDDAYRIYVSELKLRSLDD